MLSEDERRWFDKCKAIILAVHKTMIESEFKEQYYQNLTHFQSLSHEQDGDNVLRKILDIDPEDPSDVPR
jgi:hypothetical protein